MTGPPSCRSCRVDATASRSEHGSGGPLLHGIRGHSGRCRLSVAAQTFAQLLPQDLGRCISSVDRPPEGNQLTVTAVARTVLVDDCSPIRVRVGDIAARPLTQMAL